MGILLDIAIPILGIAGLCTGNAALFLVAVVLIVIDNIIGFVSGELRSLKTQIIAAVIGGIVAVLFDFNIFNSIVFALCMENAMMLLAGIAMLLLYGVSSKEHNRTHSQSQQSNKQTRYSSISSQPKARAIKEEKKSSVKFNNDMTQYDLMYDHLKKQNDNMNDFYGANKSTKSNYNELKIDIADIDFDGVQEALEDLRAEEAQKEPINIPCSGQLSLFDVFLDEQPKENHKTTVPVVQCPKPIPSQQSQQIKQPKPQPKPQPERLFCTKCGVHLPADAVFCHKCGNKVYKG